jgi:DNA-binding MarR family transcriptional regulator
MNAAAIYQAWITTSQAAIALERAVDQRLRPWNLNAAQGEALLLLHLHGPQRMSHLARFLLQQTQTTTDLVDRLERRGLVARVRHETDRRVVLVQITDAGRGLTGDITRAMQDVGSEVFGQVDALDLAEFSNTMRLIRDLAANTGGIPLDHLAYAEDRLSLAALLGERESVAAD